MRKLLVLVVVLALFAVGLYVAGGTMDGPVVTIAGPDRYIGASSELDVEVTSPGGQLESLEVVLEQGEGRTVVVAADAALPVPDADGRYRVTAALDSETLPELESGAARLVVTAAHEVLRGVRTIETVETRDLTVHLERPRLGVLSSFHYINQGGAEMVLYSVSPTDDVIPLDSGVLVGERAYPGYPAGGVDIDGVDLDDPGLRVAFFALAHDQPADVPIRLYARDAAGNEASTALEHRIFPKQFRTSRITLSDGFLERVVPPILDGTSEVDPEGTLIEQYVVVNSELRRLNNARISAFAAETSDELLWGGEVFYPFVNNAVESAFADQRTYVYAGEEVDYQVHLGFDLASTARAPIFAANRGRVLHTGELGIYGNTVILDHGMGVQSLYAHLSTIAVDVGDLVDKGEELGRSGATGLAGGDHLHFTMLVDGVMVNPVEWWDDHWIEDRILRKLR